MGQVIDYTKNIEGLNDNEEERFDEALQKYNELYSTFEDYDGGLYLWVFVPDFEEFSMKNLVIVATCLQEAIDIFNNTNLVSDNDIDEEDDIEEDDDEEKILFSLDDWSVIKYPLIQGLCI